MAARQRATRHTLEDGFVVAWDSSELDEKLREELIELASEPIGGIIADMGGDEPVPAPAQPRRKAQRRRHSRAAA